MTGLLGCGKSLLAPILYGQARPAEGAMQLNGKPYTSAKPPRRYRRACIKVPRVAATGVIIWVFLQLTRHRRLMYTIGSNERASELAGRNVQGYKIAAYMISGVTASIGGILLAARFGRGDIASGNNLLLGMVGSAVAALTARAALQLADSVVRFG